MMRGAGERVTPMPLPRLPCVLINPGVPVPTKDVFAAIGLKPGDTFAPPAGGTNDVAWPPQRRRSRMNGWSPSPAAATISSRWR